VLTQSQRGSEKIYQFVFLLPMIHHLSAKFSSSFPSTTQQKQHGMPVHPCIQHKEMMCHMTTTNMLEHQNTARQKPPFNQARITKHRINQTCQTQRHAL
jgi:hypothetical protein